MSPKHSVHFGEVRAKAAWWQTHLNWRLLRLEMVSPPKFGLESGQAVRADAAVNRLTKAKRVATCNFKPGRRICAYQTIRTPAIVQAMLTQRFELTGEFIELHKLLKFMGFFESGGSAKSAVTSGLVRVDGAVELRRGRKIRAGQTVVFENHEIKVTGLDHSNGSQPTKSTDQ